jgi:hypothetical protein
LRGRSNDGNDEDDNDESLSPPRIVKGNPLEFDDNDDGGCRHPLMMLHNANNMAIKNIRRRTSHNMFIIHHPTQPFSSSFRLIANE